MLCEMQSVSLVQDLNSLSPCPFPTTITITPLYGYMPLMINMKREDMRFCMSSSLLIILLAQSAEAEEYTNCFSRNDCPSYQSHPEFELVLPCPFTTTITIIPPAPPYGNLTGIPRRSRVNLGVMALKRSLII